MKSNLTRKRDEEENTSDSKEQNAYPSNTKLEKKANIYSIVKNFFKNNAPDKTSSKTQLSDGPRKTSVEKNKNGKENTYEDVRNGKVPRYANKPNESGIHEFNRRLPLRAFNSVGWKPFMVNDEEDIDSRISARNINKPYDRSFSENGINELNDQKTNRRDQNVSHEQIASRNGRFTDHAIFKDEAEDLHPSDKSTRSKHDQSIYDIHDQSSNSMRNHLYENLRPPKILKPPNFNDFSDHLPKNAMLQSTYRHVLKEPEHERTEESLIPKAKELQPPLFRKGFQQNVSAGKVVTNSQTFNSLSGKERFFERSVRKVTLPNMHSGSVVLLNNDETNATFSRLKSDMKPIIVSTKSSKTLVNQNLMSGGNVILEEYARSYRLPNFYAQDPIVFKKLPDDLEIPPTTPFKVPKSRQPTLDRSFSGGHIVQNNSEIIILPDLYPSRRTPPQQQTTPNSPQISFSGGILNETDCMDFFPSKRTPTQQQITPSTQNSFSGGTSIETESIEDKIFLDLFSQSLMLEEETEKWQNQETDSSSVKSL